MCGRQHKFPSAVNVIKQVSHGGRSCAIQGRLSFCIVVESVHVLLRTMEGFCFEENAASSEVNLASLKIGDVSQCPRESVRALGTCVAIQSLQKIILQLYHIVAP
jgi:hypothetical protein